MSPEHADMEADWLASELKRSTEYARTAYETADANKRQLFLANLIGTLDSLYTHYKVEDIPTDEDGSTHEYPYAQLQTPHRRKQRGFWGRLFLGDN